MWIASTLLVAARVTVTGGAPVVWSCVLVSKETNTGPFDHRALALRLFTTASNGTGEARRLVKSDVRNPSTATRPLPESGQ